jgi:hypothetical protein
MVSEEKGAHKEFGPSRPTAVSLWFIQWEYLRAPSTSSGWSSSRTHAMLASPTSNWQAHNATNYKQNPHRCKCRKWCLLLRIRSLRFHNIFTSTRLSFFLWNRENMKHDILNHVRDIWGECCKPSTDFLIILFRELTTFRFGSLCPVTNPWV